MLILVYALHFCLFITESLHGASEAFFSRLIVNKEACKLEEKDCHLINVDARIVEDKIKDHPPLHFTTWKSTHPHRILSSELYRYHFELSFLLKQS